MLRSGLEQPLFPNGFFFNEPEHLSGQTDGPLFRLSLQNLLTGLAEVRCAFAIRGEVAVSPIAAPFGSIEFTEDVHPDALRLVVNTLIDKAKATGSKRLRLVNYPNCYAPRQIHRLLYVLSECGFDLVRNTPTHYLTVDESPLTERMHAQERRRLRKAQQAGLVASHWENPCIKTVVEFIQQSRCQQGYAMTIAPDCLSRLLRQFPEQFPVFVVRDGNTMAALCVCVRVRHDILYTFLPVSHDDYRTFSPMVMLTDFLHQYSQHAGIDLIDLGPSLDADHQPKPSLARFKENMGAMTSPKLTFEIAL